MEAPPNASERALEAYSWNMVFDAATRTRYARLNCPTCSAHVDIRTGYNLGAVLIQEKFEREGWIVDQRHIRKCRCPNCQNLKRRKLMAETKPQPTPIALVSNAEEPIAPLTPSQKSKLRGMLDSWFDDTKGYYLEGKSDAWVAKELGIARKHVEDLRVAAYGELKAPPENIAIRGEIEKLRAEGLALMDRIGFLTKRLDELERASGFSTRTA